LWNKYFPVFFVWGFFGVFFGIIQEFGLVCVWLKIKEMEHASFLFHREYETI